MNSSKKRKLVFNFEEISSNLLKSISSISAPVRATLGPKGSVVAIQDNIGVRFTKDGNTVLRNMSAQDEVGAMFLKSIQDCANNVNTKAGDGTTTTTILVSDIVLNSLKMIQSGVHPVSLVKGLRKVKEIIIAEVAKYTILPSDKDFNRYLKNVAMVATNGDKEIAEVIGQAIDHIDLSYGLISVEEIQKTKTELELTDGIVLNSGYISPYLVSSSGLGGTINLNDARVLIYNSCIAEEDHEFISACMSDHASMSGSVAVPLVIICQDIDKAAMASFILSTYRGTIKGAIVKYTGPVSELEDLSIVTGATIMSSNSDYNQNAYDRSLLGKCKYVKITAHTSHFYNDASEEQVKEKVEALNQELKAQADALSAKSRDIKERISRLRGNKAAIIKVGAFSKIELGEKKDRAIDGVAAVKSAVVSGVAPGAGTFYLRISKTLKEHDCKGDKDLEKAIETVAEAFRSPITQLLKNANIEHTSIMKQIMENKNQFYCYDVENEKFCDCRENGLLDSSDAIVQIIDSTFSVAQILVNSQFFLIKTDSSELDIDLEGK